MRRRRDIMGWGNGGFASIKIKVKCVFLVCEGEWENGSGSEVRF